MKAQFNISLPKAVLFDLDGTLVDSAPDLAAAINQVKINRKLTETPYEQLRRVASAGAPGLIRVAFGIENTHADYQEIANAFLTNYANAIAVKSKLFTGIPELLDLLQKKNIFWGIVTNKRHYLTTSLVKAIGLDNVACVISGDTTPHPKPHPAPLFEAAKQIGVEPQACWFIGDDPRDIQAGHAAGMVTFAAKWGYGTGIESWNADLIVDTPENISVLIQQLSS